MNKNREHSFLKYFAAPAAVMIAASLIAPGIGEAAETEENPNSIIELAVPQFDGSALAALPNAPGALTPPPPPSPPDSFMMSLASNRYLGTTYNQISSAGANRISISAGTSSQGGAAQVGVTVYVQQWTGSSWVNVGSPRVSTASVSVSLNYNQTVAQGYYYRTQADHWAANGSARENGVSYSNSVLVAK